MLKLEIHQYLIWEIKNPLKFITGICPNGVKYRQNKTTSTLKLWKNVINIIM